MTDFSIRSLRKTWQKYPENLFRFDLDVLVQGMDRHESKVAVLAELLVRVFLSGNQQSAEAGIVNRELADGELETFLATFPGAQNSCDVLDMDLWETKTELSLCCMAALRKRLSTLFLADGVIPVYCGDKAFFIPFHFDETERTVGVYDFRATGGLCEEFMLPEWSKYLGRLGIPASVIVHCTCKEGIGKDELTGSSLMLPLQMAWWRRKGDLPQYNVFRLVSTGSFDEGLRLKSVATLEKERAALSSMPDSRFICPESEKDNSLGRHVTALPLGISRDKVLPKLQIVAEAMDKLDLEYALHRIDPMSREVRLSNYTHWDKLITRLKCAAVFDKHRKGQEEAYLINKMLLADAYRHAGNTEQSAELNDMVMNYAKKHGDRFLRQILQLKIDRMVLGIDGEAFDDIQRQAQELRPELEELQDDDLWMRYYGTLGQAQAYGALAGMEGMAAEDALECFENAVYHAETLKNDYEIAHDKNYLHLYYALFEPGRYEELEALEQAHLAIRRFPPEDEAARYKNLGYLKRGQAMAWYRRLLKTGKAPDYEIDGTLRMLFDGCPELQVDSWIRACLGKYLGALAAADGRLEDARRYFAEGVEAIKDDAPDILTFIRITVCCEAYRSLGQEGKEYLSKARDLMAGLQDNVAPLSLPKWRRYLDAPENVPFPGLEYWY